MKPRLDHLFIFTCAIAATILSSCSTIDLAGGSYIKKVRVEPANKGIPEKVKNKAVSLKHTDSLFARENKRTIIKLDLPDLHKSATSCNQATKSIRQFKTVDKNRKAVTIPGYVTALPVINNLASVFKDNPSVSNQNLFKSEGKLGFGMAALVTALIGIALIFVAPVIGFFLELVVYIFGIYGAARRKSIIDLILAILALLIATAFLLFVFQGLVN